MTERPSLGESAIELGAEPQLNFLKVTGLWRFERNGFNVSTKERPSLGEAAIELRAIPKLNFIKEPASDVLQEMALMFQ
jgi:hypothetical protein